MRAEISVPSSSVTPVARPSRTSMRATSASVRISAPASRTADAIACVIEPIPPITWPLKPWMWCSPPESMWNRSPIAVPGR